MSEIPARFSHRPSRNPGSTLAATFRSQKAPGAHPPGRGDHTSTAAAIRARVEPGARRKAR